MATVLVVDDDLDIIRLFQTALEMEGYEVLTADNGNKALSYFDEHSIDLVITDIHMPEMHGIELCYKISKIDEDIPIVAISGGGRHLDPLRAQNSLNTAELEGAVAVFMKPIKLEDLLSKVNEILS